MEGMPTQEPMVEPMAEVALALKQVGDALKTETMLFFWEGPGVFNVRYSFTRKEGEFSGLVTVSKEPTPFGFHPVAVYLAMPGDPPPLEKLPPWIHAERREDLLLEGHMVRVAGLAEREKLGERVERLLRHLIAAMATMTEEEGPQGLLG